MLDDVRPPQLDPAESAITAEGTGCLIVLLPHRGLGGISIVVWVFRNSAEVTWAQVAGLDCCHDSLDAGVSCARLGGGWRTIDFAPVIDAVREQLSVPITLRVYDTKHAAVLVRDRKGTLTPVGTIPLEWTAWGAETARPPDYVVEVRLTDPAAPPVTQASSSDRWFG